MQQLAFWAFLTFVLIFGFIGVMEEVSRKSREKRARSRDHSL